MAKVNFKNVDQYISTFPEDVQAVLEKIRKTIKEIVPEAEETISYQIPTYKTDGKYLVYFAGWKNHVSIYPVTESIRDKLKKELAAYKTSKGTIQFPIDKPLPLPLIKKIIKFMVKESGR